MKLFRTLRDKIKARLPDLSLAALIVGVFSFVLGVDIAPQEVDLIVSAVATLGAIYGRTRKRDVQ